jgi:hypothetical protein
VKYRNNGILKCWNMEKPEYWNDGTLEVYRSIIPFFHHSILPGMQSLNMLRTQVLVKGV